MTKVRRIGKFNWNDLGEIAIGACVMSFPAATTGEVWDLGRDLALERVLLFMLASFLFLGLFMRLVHHETYLTGGRLNFIMRVLSTYWVTFLICGLLLFGLDKLELMTDPLVGLKRTILVAFPASFAATVVDGLR